MSVVQLSNAEFTKKVLQSKGVVVVDFWAPWCGPCKMILPVLEELAREYKGRVKICKVNIDEDQSVASQYQVLSIPTLLFFKDGKVLNQLIGVRSAADIGKTIDSLL